MKTYPETIVAYAIGDGEDRTVKSLPEARFEKITPKPEPLKTQTFTFYEVESDEDIQTLVTDPNERANIFNRGLVLKQQTFVRGLMTSEGEDQFEPVEGAYDLADASARLTERMKATPAEKAAKLLSQLDASQIQELLARFSQAGAVASA